MPLPPLSSTWLSSITGQKNRDAVLIVFQDEVAANDGAGIPDTVDPDVIVSDAVLADDRRCASQADACFGLQRDLVILLDSGDIITQSAALTCRHENPSVIQFKAAILDVKRS